jgi:hypothetical protein
MAEIAPYNAKIPKGDVKFKSGDIVHITKEKLKFDKVYEQTFLTVIFRAVKVIDRTHQPAYELSDFRKPPIERQL